MAVVSTFTFTLKQLPNKMDFTDFTAYMNGPSCIPGLLGKDVLHGTDLDERKPAHKLQLLDPTLQARVAFWLRPKIFSLNDIKMECKSNGISVTGNKKVLALRLAMKHLPNDVEVAGEGNYAITKCSPNKQGEESQDDG